MANSVFLAPFYNDTIQLLANGAINLGGNLWCYLAGTNTAANTFTTNVGDTLNPNPIQVGPSGLFPEQIWLPAGQNTKFVITDSSNNTLDIQDNCRGIGDPSYIVTVANSAILIANESFNLANSALNDAITANNEAQGAEQLANSAQNTCAIYANANVIVYASNINFNNSNTINLSCITDSSVNRVNIAPSLNITSLLPTSDGGNLAQGWANITTNCIIQWGNVNFTTPASSGGNFVTFPEQFPTFCWSCQVIMDGAGADNGYVPRVQDVSAQGFYIYMDTFDAGVFATTNVFWFAIGS